MNWTSKSVDKILVFGADVFPVEPASLHDCRRIEQLFVSGNLGNCIIGSYARGGISGEFFNYQCFPERIPMSPEEANERFDRILIIAANWFCPEMGGRSFAPNIAWFKKIKLPVTMIGLGQQMSLSVMASIDGRKEYAKTVSPSFVSLLRCLLDHGPSIAVRGEMTKELLCLRGIPDDCVIATGCPTWFVNGSKQPEIIWQGWDGGWDGSRVVIHGDTRSVGAMFKAAADFRDVIYVVQSERELIPFCGMHPPRLNSIIRKVSGMRNTDVTNRDCWCFCPTTLSEWELFVASRSVSFGKRIHGTICALKNRVPAVVIRHDARIAEFADMFKIPSVSVTEFARETFSMRNAFENADFSFMNQTYSKLLKAYRAFLSSHGITPSESPRPGLSLGSAFEINSSQFSKTSAFAYDLCWAVGKVATKIRRRVLLS